MSRFNLLLNEVTTPQHWIEAYAEYLTEVRANWSTLQNLVNRALNLIEVPDNYDDFDPGMNLPGYMPTDVRSKVIALINEDSDFNPDAMIQIDSDRVSITDFLVDIAIRCVATEQYTAGMLQTGDQDPEEIANWLENSLTSFRDRVTNQYESKSYASSRSLGDTLDRVRDIACSTDASIAFLLASVKTTVSDRLTAFQIKLNASWDPLASAAGDTFGYFSSILSKDAVDPQSIIDFFFDQSGIDKLSDELNPNPLNTNLGQYTGSTPVPAMDFSTVKGIAKTTAAVAYTAVKAIWGGLKKVVKGVTTKISTSFKETFSDPYDLYSTGEGEANFCEDFAWIHESTLKISYPNSTLSKFLSNNIGRYETYSTLFGDLVMQFERFDPTPDASRYLDCGIKVMYKPVVLDVIKVKEALKSFVSITFTNNTSSNPSVRASLIRSKFSSYSQLNAAFRDALQGRTLVADLNQTSEYDAYVGMRLSMALLQLVLNITRMQIFDQDDGKYLTEDKYGSANLQVPLNGNITNALFVFGASGYLPNGSGNAPFTGSSAFTDITSSSSVDYSTMTANGSAGIVDNLAIIRLMQVYDRSANPLDFVFIAYKHNPPMLFRSGSLAIKTDAENQDVATKVLTAAILIAGVVILGTSAAVVTRVVKRALLRKAKSIQAVSNAALAKGFKLTRSEWRKLRRAEKRLGLVERVSAGSVGSQTLGECISKIGTSTMTTSSILQQTDESISDVVVATEKSETRLQANIQYVLQLIQGHN